MQTWIKANIGKLIARITGAETDISALNSAVGMPYNDPLNLKTRVYNLEIAPGYSDDYTQSRRAVGKWVDGKTIYKYTARYDNIGVGGSVLFMPRTGYHFSTLVKTEMVYTYTDSAYDLQYVDNIGNSKSPAQNYLDKNEGHIKTDFNNTIAYNYAYITYWFTEEANS